MREILILIWTLALVGGGVVSGFRMKRANAPLTMFERRQNNNNNNNNPNNNNNHHHHHNNNNSNSNNTIEKNLSQILTSSRKMALGAKGFIHRRRRSIHYNPVSRERYRDWLQEECCGESGCTMSEVDAYTSEAYGFGGFCAFCNFKFKGIKGCFIREKPVKREYCRSWCRSWSWARESWSRWSED